MKILPLILLYSLSVPAYTGAPSSNGSKTLLIWGVPSESVSKEDKTAPITKQTDAFISFLSENLPEYQHEYFSGNVDRILMTVRKSENTCFTASLEDRSRLEFGHWTPYMIMPPPVLVIRKDTLPLLNLHNGKVSLEELFKNKKLKGFAATSRSFGPEIDRFLKTHQYAKINRFSMDFYSQNLLEMIANNRVDYTIEHSFVFSVYNKNYKNLVMIPIQEAKKPLEIFVVCSRSPLGKEVIEKVDRIIRQNVLLASFQKQTLKIVLSKLPPAFLPELERYFKERAKKSVVE